MRTDKATRRVSGAIMAAACAAALTIPAQAASIPESTDPIILAINEWTGQHVTTHIAGEILKRMGYKVEFVTASYTPQFAAIEAGDIAAALEIWEGTGSGEIFDKAIASGKAEDLGDLGLKEHQSFWYPLYVKELCPGLPDWHALNDCAEIFATPETAPKGRLVDFPLEWGGHNQDRLDALGINFVSMPAGSEGAIVTEIKSAVARKAPILAMFWTPHWLFSEVEGEFVALPAYDGRCYEDASWGINPDKTYDCDWDRGWIKKLAWAGLKDKWPAAHNMLKQLTIDNQTQIDLIHAVDVDGKPVEEVTKAWVDANEAVWKPWTE